MTLRKSLVVIGLALMVSAPAYGEVKPIRFKNEQLSVIKRSADELKAHFAELTERNATGTKHVIMQFEQPVTDELRTKLNAAGVTLADYLGSNGFFASIRREQFNVDMLAAIPELHGVAEIQQVHKLHSDLFFNVVHDWMVVGVKPEDPAKPEAHSDENGRAANDPTVGVYVKFHSDVSMDDVARQTVHLHGGMIRSRIDEVRVMVVELPYSQIKPLSDEDGVAWIEPPLPGMSELNSENRVITQANTVQAAPYSLTGSGVGVMVYDGGRVRTTHQDFQGRAQIGAGELACTPVSDHATHVAGTIGGAGVANANNKGMAPGVSIVSYGLNQGGGCSLSQGFLYTDPGDINADYGEAINTYGADVANNSIGTNTAPNGFPCSWEGDYGVTDTVIDAIVRGSLSAGAPFRIVWANGNERQTSACNDPNVPVGYHKTAPPACAKNHITVGALNANDDSMTSFSSWGPADDGRMKPDISGPGCQSNGDGGVTSCSSSSDTGYSVKCGTSMSSPTVCGLSALLLEDYRVQFPAQPDFRNSTLKILLAHTAIDRGNPGPDNQFGYGSVRIQECIDFMRSGNYLENTVTQGQTYSIFVIVGAGDTELKVTLAWDDPPGTPNVSPALINDLDLSVFNASNAQFFPWTLGGLANPSAPAVQNQKNAVDNIEQVLISNPPPGVYRVEVHGFNVPSGPQAFSLCASPSMINCSSTGTISIDQSRYGCNAPVTVTVVDCDMNQDDIWSERFPIMISSSTLPGGKILRLRETGPKTAVFRGTITLSPTNGVGLLPAADGDTITATYVDADDGQGNFNVALVANSVVDCTPPIISNVQVSNIQARSATVTFLTDEPAKGTIRWGTACGSLGNSVSENSHLTSHTLTLTNLSPNSTYYLSAEAFDSAANFVLDNNGGACYSFMTPNIPELWTQIFPGAEAAHDLDNSMILFTPDPGISHYKACTFSISALPTDPSGGTPITTWTGSADDGNSLVTVTGGQTVKLHNIAYGSFWVGTNGNLTFASAETDYTETLAEHFSQPRICALWDDLNPGAGGQVSYKQLADRLVVTWLGVFEYSTTNPNTFQIEMFFDGKITISWLTCSSADNLVGLSPGGGLSPDFFESDHSNHTSGCGPLPPTASDSSVTVDTYANIDIGLVGSDPNGDPATFVILSLPAFGTLTDPNAGQITNVPYAIPGGLNSVRYRSLCGYVGADSFTFKVTANGDDSNTATVSINVIPLLAVSFSDDFPNLTFDNTKWVSTTATIDTLGTAEPSAPNSARFNGDPDGSDEIVSKVFNMSAESAVKLTYWYEQKGGGESPDAGDDLIVEYLNSSAAWVEIDRQLGSGPDQTTYTKRELLLPAGAYHAAFQFRIRNTATSGAFDDWFVDDVSLSTAVSFPVCSCVQKGDVDLNGVIDGRDVSRFVQVVMDPNLGNVDEKCAADCDSSLALSVADVDPFVTILLSQP